MSSKSRKIKEKKPVIVTSDDADTDLECDEERLLHRTHKDRSNCAQMYQAACRHYDVIVSSQFINQMKGVRVHLTDLALGPIDVKAMCIPLLYNTTVTCLDLSGNNLANKGVVHVMDMLKENIKIEQLHLARNNIGRSGARYICNSLRTNHRIRTLNLSGNLFSDGEAKYFADLLRENSIIKVLDLSNNHLGEQSGEILGAVLAENGALEELDLSWNHIRLHGAVALSRSLRDNDTLRRLDVSWNGFTNEGAAELGQALSENFTLRELNLNSNRINLVGLGQLAKGINQNEGLNTLKLRGNPILAIGAEMILQVIQVSENTKVTNLDINDIPVSYNFAATLEEIQQQKGDLQVKHDCKIRHADNLDKQASSLNADPLRVVMMYAKERGLNLADQLVACPESSEMCVDEAPFKSAVRRFNPPLNDLQIDSLATQLHKFSDTNEFMGVDISGLVNAEEYRKKREEHLSKIADRKEASLALDTYRDQVEQMLPEDTTLAVDGSQSRVVTPIDDATAMSSFAEYGSEYGQQDHGAVSTNHEKGDTDLPADTDTQQANDND